MKRHNRSNYFYILFLVENLKNKLFSNGGGYSLGLELPTPKDFYEMICTCFGEPWFARE